MQRILPPVIKKKFQLAKISSTNIIHRKLARNSSILRGESIQSYPKKTQRTIVSFAFALCRNFEKVCRAFER